MTKLEHIEIGDQLPKLTTKAISRTTLALYAGASGDHNPMHIDYDFAKQAGMNDVFAHGMLSVAYLGRLLTGWVAQSAIKHLEVRFTSITQLHAEIICTGVVKRIYQEGKEKLIEVNLSAVDQYHDTKIEGLAVISINH